MIILICGANGTGKTTLAEPLANILKATYVTEFTYLGTDLKGYIDGIVSTGAGVVLDYKCDSAAIFQYINPDYVVWMDTIKSTYTKPARVNYHVSKWFTDTHIQLSDVFNNYISRNTHL